MTKSTMFLLFVLTTWTYPAQGMDYFAGGPHAVVIEDNAFTDTKRKRTVPYKLYRPEMLNGKLPVVFFSHGLGGSREGAPYLGRHLASYGFLAFHIQHPGSDGSLIEGATRPGQVARALKKAARDWRAGIDRYEDVEFVIDSVKKLRKGKGLLRGHVDMKRIGFSGHSYGARTTLAVAGEKMGRRGRSFKDKRIKAAIAYSPALARRSKDPESALSPIDIPLFHMTGTEDATPGLGLTAEDRQKPFAVIASSPQYLLVLEGGDHGVFNGERLRGGPRPTDEAQWRIIKGASLAFWQAYLNDDKKARRWLDEDFARILGREGAFARK